MASATAGATPRNDALREIRVIDLTEHMAGPWCTAILGDMGADVIKIERRGTGDAVREWEVDPRNPYFRQYGRSKRSVTLDFKTAAGRAILERLIDTADVLIESFRPGTLARAGLAYEALQKRRPSLIYCGISGFGQEGPYRDRGGYDMVVQAMGGLMAVNGEPDGPPTYLGQPLCDLGSGMWAVIGILAALHQRHQTGRGQRVDCSLLETAIGFSGWHGARYLATNADPTRFGSQHAHLTPYGRFAARDGDIVLYSGNRNFDRLSRAVGRPEWHESQRFRTRDLRLTNRQELERELRDIFRENTVAHWVEQLNRHRVACAPVYSYRQMFDDPHVKSLDLIERLEDPELGSVSHLRVPVRMSASRLAVRRVAPKLGEDTETVLAELGLSTREIERLRKENVI